MESRYYEARGSRGSTFSVSAKMGRSQGFTDLVTCSRYQVAAYTVLSRLYAYGPVLLRRTVAPDRKKHYPVRPFGNGNLRWYEPFLPQQAHRCNSLPIAGKEQACSNISEGEGGYTFFVDGATARTQ